MADSLHASTISCPLHISDITVHFSNSKTNVEYVEVRIGKSHSQIEREVGKSFRRTFSPPIELSHEDTFSLRVRRKKWLRRKVVYEDIIFEPNDMFRAWGAGERQEFIKVHSKIRIIIDFSGSTTTEVRIHVWHGQAVSSGESLELRPTTSKIFRKCPRFRILVIGKTGVGKSLLINHIFGVEKTIASHNMPGDADIDHEFISPQNDKFVLHDSKGFEPGEVDNLKIVRDFIDRRRNMSAPEHQLHAVWLCFEIPRAGGRFLETGTEEFLTLKSSGTLGSIPVIVVLTKYDALIARMKRTLDTNSLNGLSNDAIMNLAKNKAEAELKDICIGPLNKFAGLDIPYAEISTHKDYRETLTRLIQITENCVGQHSAPEAAVMTSIAQRVHPGLKIKASIEVGKKKYWKALTSSTTFNNRKIWDCLYVLHTDIVRVWNFYDPHHYLHSQEFRDMMVKMVDKLVGPTANPTKTIHAVLQRFMSYIVHLTLVLQTLYLLSESQELTRRAIKLAVASYLESPMSGEVHTWIQEYDTQLTVLERADRDTLDKMVEVMQLYSINAEEISMLQAKIPPVGSSLDEPWETEKS